MLRIKLVDKMIYKRVLEMMKERRLSGELQGEDGTQDGLADHCWLGDRGCSDSWEIPKTPDYGIINSLLKR